MGAIADKHRAARAARSTPNIDGFMDGIDVELGRAVTRQLLRDYPDFAPALQRGRFNRAWLTVEDAMNAGHLDQEQANVLAGLAVQYGIPTPPESPA